MFAMSRMVTTPMMRPLSLMATAPASCSRIDVRCVRRSRRSAADGTSVRATSRAVRWDHCSGGILRDVGEGEEPEVVVVVEDGDPAAVFA